MFIPAPDVEDQPHVVTKVWRTYVIESDVILVCVIPDTGKVRVTTPVTASDPGRQKFETASGRMYQCVGPMAPDTHTFRMALFFNGLVGDVSSFTGEPDSVQ